MNASKHNDILYKLQLGKGFHLVLIVGGCEGCQFSQC